MSRNVIAPLMNSDGHARYEAAFHDDGRFEIHEYGEPNRWITCTDPVEVER